MDKDFAAWQLPTDLLDFLATGKQLEYDPTGTAAGPVVLRRPEELESQEVYVTSFDTPFEIDDPLFAQGYYVIQAVNLLASRDGEEDNEALLWFPKYQEYGQWDREHSNAIRFSAVTWPDIVREPIKYLDAKWDDDRIFAVPVTPWFEPAADGRIGDPPW